MTKEQQPQTACDINRDALNNYMMGYDPKGVIEETAKKLATNPDRVCLNDSERNL